MSNNYLARLEETGRSNDMLEKNASKYKVLRGMGKVERRLIRMHQPRSKSEMFMSDLSPSLRQRIAKFVEKRRLKRGEV